MQCDLLVMTFEQVSLLALFLIIILTEMQMY